MAKHRILVVDNEEGMLEVCGDILRKVPEAEVVLERNSLHAAEMLRDQSWDLLITDLRMPGMGGVELLRHAREADAGIAALIITAFPSVETAVECMKLGAADYITKPFLPDDLRAAVRSLLEGKRLREENALLRRQMERPYSFGDMIGQSPAMRRVFETIDRVAGTNADVLIQGETGTGKELLARSIHRLSDRHDRQFVPVDCGAIPDELLESEFFGHERGAFTGAHTRSLGLMEYAHGGTFFLDEIGELPLRLQAKLLRALQERRIRRLGGNTEIDVDVRIIAATARNLEEEIRHQRFRSDLYYRINVVRIDLPPLRERTGDIALLARHFVRQYAREMGRAGADISTEALDVLASYPWPGNVRELQNVVKRMLALTRRDVLAVDDVPDEVIARTGLRTGATRPGFFDLREAQVAAFEREYFRNLLATHRGDATRAAEEARIPRGTLYRLLNKHHLSPADFRD